MIYQGHIGYLLIIEILCIQFICINPYFMYPAIQKCFSKIFTVLGEVSYAAFTWSKSNKK